MRALASPEWSFGRDTDLLRRMSETLSTGEFDVHDCVADADLNRALTSFSGPWPAVCGALLKLAEMAFDRIDLSRHVGTHPRTGALDLCPLFGVSEAEVAGFAAEIAGRFSVPVYLYESSLRPGREGEIERMREGGFGGLFIRPPNPDFEPSQAHPQLGVALIGRCEPRVQFEVRFKTDDPRPGKEIVAKMSELRQEGDERFLGTTGLMAMLPSTGLCTVRVVAGMPDLASVDPIVEWLIDRCGRHSVAFMGAFLLGAIRSQDVEGASRLRMRLAQVLPKEAAIG